MEKRIHSKTSSNLTYRHYLFHFKWPLFGFLIVFICLLFTQMNFTTRVQFDQSIEIIDRNVIYPIDIFTNNDNKQINRSIECYFRKKDQLKVNDDAQAMKKNFKTILPLPNNQNTSKSYLILEYTKVFSRPKFCSWTNEQIFGEFCPYKNCKYTCNRTYENDAHVLLMHKRDLNYTGLDLIKRDSEQIWLLWHDESNENSTEINKYKFNWTITYRTSAEASIGAYGITVVKKKPWSIEEHQTWIDQQFVQRQNQAVWFVSNCKPKARLKKFRSLRQHYSIVAFGKCIRSNESFSLNTQVQKESNCDRQSSCEKDYLTNSKFYLAFESQTCTDYITEKFWRTLALGAIPIVSGPVRENFVRVAPPHSFIHVDDYPSDELLATALNIIATNRNIYARYHYWRRYYDVYYEGKDVEPYRFCELCYRLNTNKQRIWYENINDWFLDKC